MERLTSRWLGKRPQVKSDNLNSEEREDERLEYMLAKEMRDQDEEDFKNHEVRTKIGTTLCLPPLSLVKSFLLLGCLIFIGSQALVLRVRSFRDQKGDHMLC